LSGQDKQAHLKNLGLGDRKEQFEPPNAREGRENVCVGDDRAG
jgi:hypothetical protein